MIKPKSDTLLLLTNELFLIAVLMLTMIMYSTIVLNNETNYKILKISVPR